MSPLTRYLSRLLGVSAGDGGVRMDATRVADGCLSSAVRSTGAIVGVRHAYLRVRAGGRAGSQCLRITERGAAICGCAGLMHNAAVLFAPVSCRAIGPNLARVQ